MRLLLQLCYVLQEQKQAALDKLALQAEMRRVVQAKDSEIQGLVADRVRLDAALASIKGQVTSAASPARSDSTTSKPSVRASVDSQTLRSEQYSVLIDPLYCLVASVCKRRKCMIPVASNKQLHMGCIYPGFLG